MVTVGLMVRLEVRAGRQDEFEAGLRAALPAIEAEPGTTAWLALRLGSTSYAVVDVFPDEASRQAHLEAGRARLEAIGELFGESPSIVPTSVIAAKLPADGTAAGSPDATLEANKQTVLAFYEAAINRRDFEAASRFVGERYVQHNPRIADGVDGFEAFLGVLRESFPGLRAGVKRIFAEGDFVIVHTHAVRVPGERGTAIVDIFRLEDGKIVEHWDVMQPIPDTAANENGMF